MSVSREVTLAIDDYCKPGGKRTRKPLSSKGTFQGEQNRNNQLKPKKPRKYCDDALQDCWSRSRAAGRARSGWSLPSFPANRFGSSQFSSAVLCRRGRPGGWWSGRRGDSRAGWRIKSSENNPALLSHLHHHPDSSILPCNGARAVLPTVIIVFNVIYNLCFIIC